MDDETIPDSREGSPGATWAIHSPVKGSTHRAGARDELSRTAAPIAEPSRPANPTEHHFRDTSPVNLDSPETRRRKRNSDTAVRKRMKQPVTNARTLKRPISLEAVPLLQWDGLSKWPANTKPVKESEKKSTKGKN